MKKLKNMTKTKDKYDKAVEYLTANPSEILEVWSKPVLYPSGCLFQFVSKNGCDPQQYIGDDYCGCLTQVKSCKAIAMTKKLTIAIRNSRKLPVSGYDIKVEHLPLFAKWQRRIDKELRRE